MTIAFTVFPQKLCNVTSMCDVSLSGWLISESHNYNDTRRAGKQRTWTTTHHKTDVCCLYKWEMDGVLAPQDIVWCTTTEMLCLPVALPHYCAWWSWSDRRCSCLLASTVAKSRSRAEYCRCNLPTRTDRSLRWGKPDWEGGCLKGGSHFGDTMKWRCWKELVSAVELPSDIHTAEDDPCCMHAWQKRLSRLMWWHRWKPSPCSLKKNYKLTWRC